MSDMWYDTDYMEWERHKTRPRKSINMSDMWYEYSFQPHLILDLEQGQLDVPLKTTLNWLCIVLKYTCMT